MGERLYNYDIDYSEKIKKAEEDGNYLLAAEYEKIRNQKIDDLGRSETKTNTYTYDTPVTTIGDTNYYKTGTGYDGYDPGDLINYVTTKPSQLKRDAASGTGGGAMSGGGSGAASRSYNSSYSGSNGWDSPYGGEIEDLYKSILNRDPFTYDYTKDPAYQQYADQYTQAGNRAMQDTLGEVSARTGGLASSYAAGAAQGAYNSYMQQLAAKVPELYQLAYSMYQNDADRQLQNLNMLMGLENTQYGRYQDDRSQFNTDRAYNYGAYSDDWNRNFQTKQYADEQTQQEKSNEWYEEQVASGVKQQALQAAISNGLSQSEWEAKKQQYIKTGKGGAEVANYETYFDYMTGLTDYYAGQLS